jgi:hypothetical protein
MEFPGFLQKLAHIFATLYFKPRLDEVISNFPVELHVLVLTSA